MKKLFLPIGALALYSSAVAQQQSDRPNVLLIYADDIGYGDLSCNGTSAVRTPNVEKLASEGIRFYKCPLCCGYKYSFALCHAYGRICLA